MTSLSFLFSINDLEQAYLWIFDIRKEYSHNCDIWDLRHDWEKVKYSILNSLNDGSYQFDALRRYHFEDKTISLWSSKDMIALKLITQMLGMVMKDNIPKTCYHVKGHGGLKHDVRQTHKSLDQYQYVMRSDIKSYYDSIRYDSLMNIIEGYVKDPILLNLTYKALQRTETYGGLFYDFDKKGIPMGSPLSPLLGAIALIPLDLAISKTNDVFYARFMDDWCILTKTKTALRKIVKKTHTILKSLHLDLHPMKTYIGKISHGFNFLAYYMDNKKILPSKETIRRFDERAFALYEQSLYPNDTLKKYKKQKQERDISNYQVNEEAPLNDYFKNVLSKIVKNAENKPEILKRLRKYLNQWARWIKLGLTDLEPFIKSVENHLSTLSCIWNKGDELSMIIYASIDVILF